MKVELKNGFSVSDITALDKSAYVEHLAEKQIHDQTLNIPHPYTEADADGWIAAVAGETKKQGRSVNWAIRNENGHLIGGIGFHGLELGKTHKAEIGYWLAKPYWGRGVMTEAVRKITQLGFAEFGLLRITANVFHFNLGSAKVLRKAGYQVEGRLRRYYRKNGKIFDGILFSRLNEPHSGSTLEHLEFVYLFVADLPRNKAWFEEILGVPPSIENGFFVEFRLGSSALCLHPADEKSPLTTGGSVGYWRVHELAKAVEHFISHGASLYRGPLDIGNGEAICQMRTPFGNVVGLIGKKSF